MNMLHLVKFHDIIKNTFLGETCSFCLLRALKAFSSLHWPGVGNLALNIHRREGLLTPQQVPEFT